MNKVNVAIVIIARFVRRNTQIKKTHVRSNYVNVLHQITVLDICKIYIYLPIKNTCGGVLFRIFSTVEEKPYCRTVSSRRIFYRIPLLSWQGCFRQAFMKQYSRILKNRMITKVVCRREV